MELNVDLCLRFVRILPDDEVHEKMHHELISFDPDDTIVMIFLDVFIGRSCKPTCGLTNIYS